MVFTTMKKNKSQDVFFGGMFSLISWGLQATKTWMLFTGNSAKLGQSFYYGAFEQRSKPLYLCHSIILIGL